MKNKDSYYRILNLTAESGWINRPEVVQEVQEIGKRVLLQSFK